VDVESVVPLVVVSATGVIPAVPSVPAEVIVT